MNSIDVTRRPLIVSDSSKISICDLAGRFGCEAVVDGSTRVRVRREVEVCKADSPFRLLRLPKESQIADRMVRKVMLAEELTKMPPSAKLVLKTLQYEGPLTYREIVEKTMLPERTARLALSTLVERGLVKRERSLGDLRRSIYRISEHV